MEEMEGKTNSEGRNTRTPEIIYDPDKDFYKGIGGKLRLKAEGLFKKAKEKGISIEEISIDTLRESQVEFPGIGVIDLPAYIVKVRGRENDSGQVMADGKHLDYFNRYQKFIAERIENKNSTYKKGGNKKHEDTEKTGNNLEMSLTEWERFEIGKNLVEDKEFGIEKTITGACDRVIRKLMGENDWLYPEEARLLDEEFNDVQARIAAEGKKRNVGRPGYQRCATERQINYLKARIKNLGLNPESEVVIRELMRQSGFDKSNLNELSTIDMSRVIDCVNEIVPKIKQSLPGENLN